jgi:glycosyltransferase involved in cell wall biosynthesis
MKTVVVVQPSAELGGLEIGLHNWLQHLDPEEFRRVVVLPQDGAIVPIYRSAGIEVRFLSMARLRTVKSVFYQANYLWQFWPTVIRLARTFRKERAAVVHSNSLFSLYGGWAARLARVPHVWHVHEIPDQPRMLIRLLTEMTVRLSARVITISSPVNEIFSLSARRSGRVMEVTEGIDVERFNPSVRGDRIRRELGLPAGSPLVGWAGRLDPWKGGEVFLRAAAEVHRARPNVRFVVCGGVLPGYEAYAADLCELQARLGLADSLQFTGWRYTWQDMPEVMAAVDLLVHTPVRSEPLGLVVLEAMAAAKPVVAPAAGGPSQTVEPGVTGLLVPPGDHRATARAMMHVLDNVELARSMGRAARERVQSRFNARSYAARIANVYREIWSPTRLAA